jgi:hypothetical protein
MSKLSLIERPLGRTRAGHGNAILARRHGVIRRSLTERDGAWYATERGWSFGPDSAQPAFLKWLAQIQELDRRMKAAIERQHL